MTSHVVSAVRKILNTKKVGHTGTLDPDASGVLPICIGKATKVSELILNKDKSYICELTLGITTDTYDSSGEILERVDNFSFTKEEIEKAEKEDREPLIIPHFSAHHLRHTFCTRLCENESNLKVIQSIMGHSDITTTMDIYAEATQEKKQEIVANLQGKIII